MPEIDDLNKVDLAFLYTNIGRGHPAYLDGIIESFDSNYPEAAYFKSDVFGMSSGLSLAAWGLVRRLYFWGGHGGLITSLYGMMRKTAGAGNGGLLTGLLGRDLKKKMRGFKGLVIVAHPILARILAEGNRVIYQHGELAAPSESIVRGCGKILVPRQETADIFAAAGIDSDDLIITGQGIETELVSPAPNAFEHRLARIRGDRPLTAALFTSGAYPAEHLRRLRLMAQSLFGSGLNVYIFAGQSRRVAASFEDCFKSTGPGSDRHSGAGNFIKVVGSNNRRDENQKVAAVFDQIDFFASPAHERTNWSIGLGLPQFIIGPHIGSYAPLNAAFAIAQDTALVIDTRDRARHLGKEVNEMRSRGRLETLARNGYGKSLKGFERCAEVIFNDLKKSS
jgi:hypothetical protein